MIYAEELRPGNRVFWKPKMGTSNVLMQVEVTSILQDKVGYIRSHLEHRVEPFEDNEITKGNSYASFEELQPIPLSDITLKYLDKKMKYPSWIQYLHELQNWYYWEHEKHELEIND